MKSFPKFSRELSTCNWAFNKKNNSMRTTQRSILSQAMGEFKSRTGVKTLTRLRMHRAK